MYSRLLSVLLVREFSQWNVPGMTFDSYLTDIFLWLTFLCLRFLRLPQILKFATILLHNWNHCINMPEYFFIFFWPVYTARKVSVFGVIQSECGNNFKYGHFFTQWNSRISKESRILSLYLKLWVTVNPPNRQLRVQS